MKKILLLLLLFCSQINLNATHLPYVDISYKCLGGSVYVFTVNLYVDCTSLGFTPSTVGLNICSGSGGSSASPPNMYLDSVPGSGINIYPLCAYPLNTCTGDPYIGFMKWTYKDTLTLTAASDWIVSYDKCCRESFINTIVSPGSISIGIQFEFDNLNFPGNSSPEFVGEPILFACCNQLYSYNQSAIDPDGDSLVYSFYQPHSMTTSGMCNATSSDIVYNPGYSYDTVITSSPTISINSQTGFVTMNPTNCNEKSVIGIRVDEYRNGVLIGYIERDNTIIITNQTAAGETELESKSNFEIFPNPSSGNFSYSTDAKNYLIELFNLTGQLVYSTSEINTAQEINSELAPGIYFYHFSSAQNYKSGKIIIE